MISEAESGYDSGERLDEDLEVPRTATPISDAVALEAVTKYMNHKGYDLQPIEVTRLEDQPCWYFLYDLDDGEVEVEVIFEGGDWEFHSDWLG